jgi:hypothetical protein
VEKIRIGINTGFHGFDPAAGALHNMSVPPRTRFEAVVRPVTGQFVVFRIDSPNFKLTKSQLARPVFALGFSGFPSIEEVEAAALSIPAFLIGIKLDDSRKASFRQATTAAAIAVLSRRVGEIYVRSRQPDYSAKHIFSGHQFAVEAWGEAS